MVRRPPRTLILRPGALGDTLMVLPALVDLAGRSTITFVGRQPGIAILHHIVNDVLDFESGGWHRLFMSHSSKEKLPVSQADRVIAFLKDPDAEVKRNLSGFFHPASIHLFPSVPEETEHVHTAFYICECLKASGFPVIPKRAIDRAQKHPCLKRTPVLKPRTKMVFHPGSGNRAKNHPPEFWLKILLRITTDPQLSDYTPILLIGPAERPFLSYYRKKTAAMGVKIGISNETGTLLRLLEDAGVYIGHDSGVTHLAGMLGIPTIALFKIDNAEQWRPLSPVLRLFINKKAGPELEFAVLDAVKSIVSKDTFFYTNDKRRFPPKSLTYMVKNETENWDNG